MSIKDIFLNADWSKEAADFFEERSDNHDILLWAKRLGAQVKVPDRRTPPKISIPDHLRWEVWERDNFTCQECGARRFLTVDHILAESKGGGIDSGNLQTLCASCNSRKGAR